MHKNDIWIKECAWLFATGDQSFLDTVQVEDFPRIPVWSDHLFHRCARPYSSLCRNTNKLNGRRCHAEDQQMTFLQRQVEYLGHMFEPRCLEIDETNVASLWDAKHSKSKTKIRSFSGFCDLCRRFIDDLIGLEDTLNKLLQKGAPDSFMFYNEQNKSFDSLITKICSPSIMALPRAKLSY